METKVKFKTRMEFIAAAVAFGLSASAHAITVTASNLGAASFSELILIAYDETKVGTGIGTTYVRGLGVQMDAFLPNSPLVTNPVVTVNSGAATVFAGGTRTGEGFSNAPVAGDTNWATFTAAVGSLSNIRWGVVGRKAGTAAIANQYPAAVYTGVAFPVKNQQVQTLSSAFNNLMGQANAQGCDGATDSCVTEIDVGSNLGAPLIFHGVGSLSEILGFTLAFKNTNLGGISGGASVPALVPFCTDFACGSWSINGATGEVLYTAPVPLPAAAWLMVVGLLGMVGMGRRKAARV